MPHANYDVTEVTAIKHLSGATLFSVAEVCAPAALLQLAINAGVCLAGANLGNWDLSMSAIFGGDLRGANLKGADLWQCEFNGTDLRGADFAGADLISSRFDEVDLRGTTCNTEHFSYAQLTNCKL